MKFLVGTTIYEIGERCLETFRKNRQITSFAKETGGQLFAQFSNGMIFVEVATVTRGRSKRSRFGFFPDRKAEKREIEDMFHVGFHYVGDWHTHPEFFPEPSFVDEKKITEVFLKSIHELDRILLVIVGLSPFPEGLYVGSTDGEKIERTTSDCGIFK